MYCKNCGNEIDDLAVVCPHCGCQVQKIRQEETKTNVLAIVGFVLSFLFAIAGLICSILGRKEADKMGGSGRNLATAGIVISIVSIAGSVLYLILTAIAMAAL